MKKYIAFIAYGEGLRYQCESDNSLPSTHKAYDTAEECINAVVEDICQSYNTEDYLDFYLYPPEVCEYGGVYNGMFRCAYKFGPMVTYTIFIRDIEI